MHNEPARKALFEDELNTLVADLINGASYRDGQCYWQCLHREPYGPIEPAVREAIYNGNTGILLFFADLFRFTQNQRYLEVSEKGCAYWLAKRPSKDRAYYTLYTGWMGLVLLCLRLYELTEKHDYLMAASQKVEEWEDKLLNEVPLDDLISGHAGNALVLAQLYGYTRKTHHLRMLQTLIEKLIKGAKISRNGLKWGYKTNALDSFTGMSHGAAGIGHVLLQLYSVTGEKALLWMGEKAFRFEGEYYSRKLGAWVDLRIFPEHKQLSLLHEQGISLYFAKRTELNTWAHGMAGMGLARFAAYTCTGSTWLLREAERCVHAVLMQMEEPMGANFTLSTGYGSWIALLMEAHRIFPKRGYLDRADSLLLKAIESKRKQGFYASSWYLDRPDPALMVGSAGIGALLLQRIYQPEAPALLLPKIRLNAPFSTGFDIRMPQGIKVSLLKKYLSDTFATLDEAAPFMARQFERLSFLKREWEHSLDIIGQSIKRLPENKQKKQLLHLFRWERRALKQSMDPGITLYREIRSEQFAILANQVDAWQETQFERHLFACSKHVLLGDGQIIRHDADEPRRFKVTPFATLLLQHMRRPVGFQQLVVRMTGLVRGAEDSVLREKISIQLRAFIKQWFVEVIK